MGAEIQLCTPVKGCICTEEERAQRRLKVPAATWLNCSDICLLSWTAAEGRKEMLVLRRGCGEGLRLRDRVCGEMVESSMRPAVIRKLPPGFRSLNILC